MYAILNSHWKTAVQSVSVLTKPTVCDNGAKVRVDEQLIIFYSLQRKDRIKEQFCYKRRELIKRSQITFKNTTSRIFFPNSFHFVLGLHKTGSQN